MKVVFEPELPEWQRFPRPVVSAVEYRLGTVVEDDRGARWVVEWDEQDRGHMWSRVPGFPAGEK